MNVKKASMAGTMESSDAVIRIMPNDGLGIRMELDSTVAAQFGDDIRRCVMSVLQEFKITNADVMITDRGALDCVLRARTRCACCRALEIKYDWRCEDHTNG